MRLITTSVPPSVLFQSADHISKSGQNVKVKRKCGRPRNPIPRHKRVSHLSAEHRRRNKIQEAFRNLKNLVPPQTQISGRVSKADVLFRAVDKCRDLEHDLQNLKSATQFLTSEKEALSLDIKAYKAFVQDVDIKQKQPALTLDDLYASYVQVRSKTNSFFKFFVLMMGPLFESFKMAVNDKPAGQFLAVIRDWAFKHLTVSNLRTAFVSTNDITVGSNSVLKNEGHEMNVPKSMTDFVSQKSTQVSPTSTAPMPVFSHPTSPFQKPLAVFKKKDCLQSNEEMKPFLMTSQNEHFGGNSQVNLPFNSSSRPEDQNIAAAGVFPGSPRLGMECNDCGSHNFHSRYGLNDQNFDLSNQNTSYNCQSNAHLSFYQFEASGISRMDSRKSTSAISPPFPRVHNGIRNNTPSQLNIPAVVSKDTASGEVNHENPSLMHARMSVKSERSTVENITSRVHSSQEPCRHSEYIIDHYPTLHPTGNGPPSYDAQIETPDSLSVCPGDQISPISGFLSPRMNTCHSFVSSRAMCDKSHSFGNYSSSHQKSTTVESHCYDKFRNRHTALHLPHDIACLSSPRSCQDQIQYHDSFNGSVRDNAILHQQPSLDSPVEFTPYRPFSFLSQLLSNPNTSQSVLASREENERFSLTSYITPPNALVKDNCHISPIDRSKFYEKIPFPAPQGSLLSSLDFVPQSNQSSGRSCRFTNQSKTRQKIPSPSEPVHCSSPDTPTFLTFGQTSEDQVSPGIQDSMWSVTRSDQVISPCSDDAIQREFTSPKISPTMDNSFGGQQGQGRDSLNHSDRTSYEMECKARQRNEVLSPRTSPLTYINMDANQIVSVDDKQPIQLNVPLAKHNRSDVFGGKRQFETFWSPLKRKYSDFE